MRPRIASAVLVIGPWLAFAAAIPATGLTIHDSASDTNSTVAPTAAESGHDVLPASVTIKIVRAAASGSLRLQLDIATGAATQDNVSGALSTSATDEIFWDGFELCGDGVIETPEQCDRQDLGGASCLSQGYSGGVLGCDNTCHFDTSQCTGLCPPICITDADCGACGPCIPLGGGTGICIP